MLFPSEDVCISSSLSPSIFLLALGRFHSLLFSRAASLCWGFSVFGFLKFEQEVPECRFCGIDLALGSLSSLDLRFGRSPLMAKFLLGHWCLSAAPTPFVTAPYSEMLCFSLYFSLSFNFSLGSGYCHMLCLCFL